MPLVHPVQSRVEGIPHFRIPQLWLWSQLLARSPRLKLSCRHCYEGPSVVKHEAGSRAAPEHAVLIRLRSPSAVHYGDYTDSKDTASVKSISWAVGWGRLGLGGDWSSRCCVKTAASGNDNRDDLSTILGEQKGSKRLLTQRLRPRPIDLIHRLATRSNQELLQVALIRLTANHR